MTIIPFKQYLLRESYTRILNILRGDVPEVKTLAIMTAWNPMGDQSEAKDNNARNRELIDRLRNAHFNGFKVETPIYGKYDNLEKGYLIPHISKELAISLASEFCQKALIFGARKEKEGEAYIEFEWVQTSADDCKDCTPESFTTVEKRSVVLTGKEAQERSDYFSATPYPSDLQNKRSNGRIDPRKFWIPFFDDAYSTAAYTNGKRKVDSPPKPIGGQEDIPLRKAESYEPEIDVHLDVSFVSSSLPEKVSGLVSEIKKCETGIYDANKTESYRWICRGNLNRLVKELALAIR